MQSKKNFKEKQYSCVCFKCLDYIIDKKRLFAQLDKTLLILETNFT